jgi:predicted branched-subunit amino acid permease
MARPARSPFLEGVVAIAPILIGVFPFGVIAGIAAVEAGLATVQAYAASPIVFAGAAQLAMMDLIGRDAAPFVIVGTAWVINTRLAMYSAGLAPVFKDLSPFRKAYGSYLLTDQGFAVSVVRFGAREENLRERFAFYLGASLGLWTTWQVATIVGVALGTGVPESWSLDFAIPLVFMALLFPAITDRGTSIAAIVGALAAIALIGLPLNLGLLAASAIALGAGALGSHS